MTITTNATRNEYTATSGQTVFNYTFKIFADTELSVYQTADGATPDDTTDLITAYTVSGVGNENGGSITLTTGATLNDKITIVSNIAQSRTTDYQFNGDFSADVVDDDFDRTVSLVKQLSDEINRTPRFDKAVQGLSGVKIAPPVASEFLRWNVAGTDLESVSLNTVSAGDNAAAISFSNTTSGLSATDVQGAIDEIDSTIDKVNTLSGVAKDAVDLGTFTGATITDNVTVKVALQELEIKAETNAASIAALPTLASGSWTPTIFSSSGITSPAIWSAFYVRVGSIVTISGRIAGTSTSPTNEMQITLPVSSNFTNSATDANGVISGLPASQYTGAFYANSTNDTLDMRFESSGAGSLAYMFSGQYIIK